MVQHLMRICGDTWRHVVFHTTLSGEVFQSSGDPLCLTHTNSVVSNNESGKTSPVFLREGDGMSDTLPHCLSLWHDCMSKPNQPARRVQKSLCASAVVCSGFSVNATDQCERGLGAVGSSSDWRTQIYHIYPVCRDLITITDWLEMYVFIIKKKKYT